MLRNVLGPKRDKVNGDWRKARNDEFHGLHWPDTRVIKSRGGVCVTLGGEEKCVQDFGGET